jgi:hypothetical protein
VKTNTTMPVKTKVIFDDDGKRCPLDPVKAHRVPGCEVVDIDRIPFVPQNRPRRPPSKFKPFTPSDKPIMLRGIPHTLTDPFPRDPHFGNAPVYAVGPGVRTETGVLGQDETNKNVRVRGHYENTYANPHDTRFGRYVPVPTFEQDQPILPVTAPKRTLEIATVEETVPLTSPFKRTRLSDPGLRRVRSTGMSPPSDLEFSPLSEPTPTGRALFSSIETPRPPSARLGTRTLESIDRISTSVANTFREGFQSRFGEGYQRVLSDTAQIQSLEMAEMGRVPDVRLPPPDPPPSPPPPGVRKAQRILRNPFEQQPTRLVSTVGTELVDYAPPSRTTPTLEPMELETPEVTAVRRPGLSFLSKFERPSTGIALPRRLDAGVGRTLAASGAGAAAGILTNVGLSHLLPDTMPSRFANAAVSGGVSDVAGRMAVHIAERSAAGIGSSIARGFAEGGIIGLGTFGLDMALNQAMTNAGASHGLSNTISSGVAGGVGTAATGIMLASAGAAPETLGLSLIIGGLASIGTMIYGGVTGAQQDAQEQANRDHIRNTINYAVGRNRFLKTLPSHNYNFQEALAAYGDKASLGMDDDSWRAFSASSSSMFTDRPSNTQPLSPADTPAGSDDERKMNQLYSQYVQHTLIDEVCAGGRDCGDARRTDPGMISDEDVEFMNQHSADTWRSQADMQVTMSLQELNYNRQRVENAQKELIRLWDEEDKTPADGVDPYLIETANLDKRFPGRFADYMREDAMKNVIDAYYKDQTRLEQLPPSVQNMARLNIGFNSLIHAFYADMDNASNRLKITVPQLIQLQGLDRTTAVREYGNMQFERQKENPEDVRQAAELSDANLRVKQAGFYDLDQAVLETDPTHIDAWHPTDSQILQAHAAGMNLNEYVAYMGELAKGQAGDYQNLPQYDQEERRRIGYLDYGHLQDELQLAGYDPRMYSYNPNTRQFTLNPNVSNVPSTDRRRLYASRYTPSALRKSRSEYADMVHGLNHDTQQQVDSFNTQLREELLQHGNEYENMVNAQNEYIARTQRNPEHMLHYNVEKIYDRNKLTFHPLSDHTPPAGQTVPNPIVRGETTPVDTVASSDSQPNYLNQYGEISETAMDAP